MRPCDLCCHCSSCSAARTRSQIGGHLRQGLAKHWVLTGDEAAWTTEVRYTDRFGVFHRKYASDFNPDLPGVDLDLLYESLTGDVESATILPLPAARWLTSPNDFAAIVMSRGPNELQVEMSSFVTERDLQMTALAIAASEAGR